MTHTLLSALVVTVVVAAIVAVVVGLVGYLLALWQRDRP